MKRPFHLRRKWTSEKDQSINLPYPTQIRPGSGQFHGEKRKVGNGKYRIRGDTVLVFGHCCEGYGIHWFVLQRILHLSTIPISFLSSSSSLNVTIVVKRKRCLCSGKRCESFLQQLSTRSNKSSIDADPFARTFKDEKLIFDLWSFENSRRLGVGISRSQRGTLYICLLYSGSAALEPQVDHRVFILRVTHWRSKYEPPSIHALSTFERASVRNEQTMAHILSSILYRRIFNNESVPSE